MRIKINSAFIHGCKVGDIVNIAVDKNDVPTDQFWRQRLKDSIVDNCIEPILHIGETKSKTKKLTREQCKK